MQPRLALPATMEMTARQREIHDAIASGPRGVVEGPLGIWLHSAELADRAQSLGAFCRFGTSLPPHLSELAILITGAFWQAGFEWHVHAPLARAAGIPEPAIEAIRRGEAPAFDDPKMQSVQDLSRELLENRSVSDGTYARAVATLGQRGVVELIGILGYYALISMTIKAFQVPVPNGFTEPFASP